jgi:hypothetical protein
MLFPEVLLIPPPRIISAVLEYSVLIFTWVRLRGANRVIEYDTILHFDVSPSQECSIMVDDRLVRIGVVTLKWSAPVYSAVTLTKLTFLMTQVITRHHKVRLSPLRRK